ncbi:hypothetical protein PFLUV_G00230640 [Perca fluviatilis]|uniref:Uncharacterized protein n=1 Tax=Perca fluviatilis TaxID=8168 RepID=A0A6A5DQG1_PERFL|nr:hypothetical protein PFLUV_G00230640 [Perca fluviatilis]
MATRFKATTPKCASGIVPGNTTALCADCLWINDVLQRCQDYTTPKSHIKTWGGPLTSEKPEVQSCLM